MDLYGNMGTTISHWSKIRKIGHLKKHLHDYSVIAVLNEPSGIFLIFLVLGGFGGILKIFIRFLKHHRVEGF